MHVIVPEALQIGGGGGGGEGSGRGSSSESVLYLKNVRVSPFVTYVCTYWLLEFVECTTTN